MGATELIFGTEVEREATRKYSPSPTYPPLDLTGVKSLSQSSSKSKSSSDTDDDISEAIDDEIVISGVAGRFPEASNVDQFSQNLFNGVDMVTENSARWPLGLFGLPRRSGTLGDLSRFDARFFKVPHKQAAPMDPQLRILLELTFEAILDAGINPISIRGTRTGVFIGTSWTEVEQPNGPQDVKGYTQQAAIKSMLANRLSFGFDFHGPSFVLDTACSSSLFALHQAVGSIQLGHCDAAIVGGINFSLDPLHCLRFSRLKILSPDGKCKSFDASADGYARSESAVIIYIQRRQMAIRQYASILHIKTNIDGYKKAGPVTPSRKMQAQLLKEIYAESGVNAKDIAFIEAHGTGTLIGDRAELNSLEDVFGPYRSVDEPLLIGAVKTNMGHSEAASGLVSIVKVLIAMQQREIPANLHFKIPNPDAPCLVNGTFKLVTENTPLNPSSQIVGVSGFGVGGANAHVILKTNYKENSCNLSSPIPYLIPFSGRTREAVQYALEKITADDSKLDVEMIAILHHIYQKNIPGHDYRGYKIHPGLKPEMELHVQPFQSQTAQVRPVWFIFSGMGSQWSQMGRDLYKFQIFQKALEKPSKILRTVDISLEKILLDENYTHNIVSTMISLVAMQIGLIDLLRSIGITARGLVGHSLGEIGAAYADSCLTSEEAIMSAWARGKALLDCKNLIGGAMASVGLTWEEAQSRCPEGIIPACHNSVNNVTISGDLKKIEEFLEELKGEGIFGKLIDSSNIPFHSPYIKEAAPLLKRMLDEIIKTPSSRSRAWLSTSIDRKEWASSQALCASSDYFVNNFVSPVLFHDVISCGEIEENSIVIEIAPHGLLQPILKRSLPSSCLHLSLMDKKSEDNAINILDAIGQLFEAGLNPSINNLYEPVQWPVGSQAGFISPLIQWDHSVVWEVPNFSQKPRQNGTTFKVSLDGSQKFYEGHRINGHILYPASGYFEMVWEAFARIQGVPYDTLPVIFEDLSITRATILQEGIELNFVVKIEENGKFIVSEGTEVAATGIIRLPHTTIEEETLNLKSDIKPKDDTIPLDTSDIYKILRLRGHDYTGQFRGLTLASSDGCWGQVSCKDKNMICLLDGIAQLYFLTMHDTGRAICLPTGIKKIVIDPKKLLSSMTHEGPISTTTVTYNRELDVLMAPGIELRRFSMRHAPKRVDLKGTVLIEEYTFTPFFDEVKSRSLEQTLRFCIDIVAQNITDIKFNILELTNEENSMKELISKMFLPQVYKECELTTMDRNELTPEILQSKFHLVITDQMESLQNISDMAHFILYKSDQVDPPIMSNYRLVAHKITDCHFYLLRNEQDIEKISDLTSIFIEISMDWDWLEELKTIIGASVSFSNPPRIYLTSQSGPTNGILGLLNCLRLETKCPLRCYFSMEKTDFDFRQPDNDLAKILGNDLTVNVYRQNGWGTMSHFEMEPELPRESQWAFIQTVVKGDLSSLRWVQKSEFSDPHLHCQVHYGAVSTIDIMLASGHHPPDSFPAAVACREGIMGTEYSGVSPKGDRIMGLVPTGGLSTKVIPHNVLTWSVPLEWSLEQAASVPQAYSLAYYGMMKGKQFMVTMKW